MQYPHPVEELMEYLRRLPGIGRRAAERAALDLTGWAPEEQLRFGELCSSLPKSVGLCPRCGALAEAGVLCEVCADPRRDASLLCVVETISQLLAVERGGQYRGRYLVLGGKLSPLDGEDGTRLNFTLLKQRASEPGVQEVILALSSDVEGRATAGFIADLLRDLPLKITQPARGLPAGANLSYADGDTIAAAFTGRTHF